MQEYNDRNWVIAEDPDGGGHLMTTRTNWDAEEFYRNDFDGRPRTIVHEFQADTYAEAKAIYNKLLGYE